MRWSAGALVVVLLAAGCASTVDGSARPAATALGLLPTEAQISNAAGNTLSTFGFEPFVGGVDILPDGYRADTDASPIGCIAVTDTAPRIVYEPAPVLEAARQSYFTWAQGVDTSGADAAVIRLATAEAAQNLFSSSVRQWQECGGATVTKHLRNTAGTGGDSTIEAVVNEVALIGPMLSATVRTRGRTDVAASRYERALGVRGDTIVEVSLAVTPEGERHPVPRARAVRVAQSMLDEVG